MARILHFTKRPEDWKELLASPGHWKPGHSAYAVAHCWERADGFPTEVSKPFIECSDPLLANIEPLLAVPEFKVQLPGGGRDSQNDIFILAKSSAGPVSIMVEGKVDESFGETLGKWLKGASRGKKERLAYLLRMLGLRSKPGDAIRYQLLHRAASAVIIGKQYRASAALILIHSFSRKRSGWSDYSEFTRLFRVEAEVGTVKSLTRSSAIPLFGLWVDGKI